MVSRYRALLHVLYQPGCRPGINNNLHGHRHRRLWLRKYRHGKRYSQTIACDTRGCSCFCMQRSNCYADGNGWR
jgi:hypothetical protein